MIIYLTQVIFFPHKVYVILTQTRLDFEDKLDLVFARDICSFGPIEYTKRPRGLT